MVGIAAIDKDHTHITGLLEPVADKCEGGANSQRALHGCSRNGPRSWLIISSCQGCPIRAPWRSSSCDVDSHSNIFLKHAFVSFDIGHGAILIWEGCGVAGDECTKDF